MQILPEEYSIFAHGFVDGALIGDTRRPRRALEIEHSAHGFPRLHGAIAAEDSTCGSDVAVLDHCREEELIHGDDWATWLGVRRDEKLRVVEMIASE